MAKPLKKSLTVSTEIVHAGQPSAGLLAELKTVGERLTAKQLATSLEHVEGARVGFVVEAIATGILLLAKKQSLDRGGWQPFCGQVWQAIGHNGNGASDSPSSLDNFTRSLRHYTFLGQHFLADLDQSNFQPDARDEKVVPPAIAPSEVLALDKLPQEKRVAVYGAIERFVAGRSLRRMLIDFRRAENAADQEEVEEENRKRKKKKPDADPNQIDFFEEMMRPVREIAAMFKDKTFVAKTDRAFWASLAVSLETQASLARKMAKEISA